MGEVKFIDHTADACIEVTAANRDELFTLAARGLYGLIADLKNVEPTEERRVELKAEDLAGLLHEWLAELIYIFDVDFELYREYAFSFSEDETGLSVVLRGESVAESRHDVYGEVKNVTYCDYEVRREDDGYFARIVFDL
ncbi:MAG: archease [bacterium]|nr:archease [bacterium]